VSPARRLIILAGFTLMVAGIVLLLSQEEEVFVALSVLGFVVVVAAVPRLSREPSDAGWGGTADEPPAEAGFEPPTDNVTVVPGGPTLEHAAVADPKAPDDQEPQPEPAAAPPGALEPAPPAPLVAAPAPPKLAEPAPAPPFPAPERWGTWQPPSPPADGQAAAGPAGLSARKVAAAGAAAGAAGALLLAWRRARR